MHDRVMVMHIDVALRSIRMPPVGALHELPPLAPVAQIRYAWRRREHQRAGVEHMRQSTGVILRIGRKFGEGDVPCRLTNSLNCRFVTGVRSIQKSATVTRWAGASSG